MLALVSLNNNCITENGISRCYRAGPTNMRSRFAPVTSFSSTTGMAKVSASPSSGRSGSCVTPAKASSSSSAVHLPKLLHHHNGASPRTESTRIVTHTSATTWTREHQHLQQPRPRAGMNIFVMLHVCWAIFHHRTTVVVLQSSTSTIQSGSCRVLPN